MVVVGSTDDGTEHMHAEIAGADRSMVGKRSVRHALPRNLLTLAVHLLLKFSVQSPSHAEKTAYQLAVDSSHRRSAERLAGITIAVPPKTFEVAAVAIVIV